MVSVAEACEAWLASQGRGEDDKVDAEEDDAQAVLQQASLLGMASLGSRAGKAARRVQTFGGREVKLPPRCAGYEGYNLHAGVGVAATDRGGLERLCRYLLRPPLPKDLVERREDGNVVVTLKRVPVPGAESPCACAR